MKAKPIALRKAQIKIRDAIAKVVLKENPELMHWVEPKIAKRLGIKLETVELESGRMATDKTLVVRKGRWIMASETT